MERGESGVMTGEIEEGEGVLEGKEEDFYYCIAITPFRGQATIFSKMCLEGPSTFFFKMLLASRQHDDVLKLIT